MLSVDELLGKIANAYDHARKNNVEEFQAMDDEITSYIPHYVQQIKYSNEEVVKLNKLQLSNLLTQTIKICSVGVAIFLVVFGVSYIPYEKVGALLASVVMAAGLFYVWKKIPDIRQLWQDNGTINQYGINLNTSLSQSIIALSYIQEYHVNTISKVSEWDKKGLLKKDNNEDQSKTTNLNDMLESIQNRSQHKDKDDLEGYNETKGKTKDKQ